MIGRVPLETRRQGLEGKEEGGGEEEMAISEMMRMCATEEEGRERVLNGGECWRRLRPPVYSILYKGPGPACVFFFKANDVFSFSLCHFLSVGRRPTASQ